MKNYVLTILLSVLLLISACATDQGGIVPVKKQKLPAWTKGLRIYYTFMRNGLTPDRPKHVFGNVLDFIQQIGQAERLGFNAVFVMPC